MSVATGDTVQSQVSGSCPDCHYSYVPGSLIRFIDGRWRHSRCPGQDTTDSAQHTAEV